MLNIHQIPTAPSAEPTTTPTVQFGHSFASSSTGSANLAQMNGEVFDLVFQLMAEENQPAIDDVPVTSEHDVSLEPGSETCPPPPSEHVSPESLPDLEVTADPTQLVQVPHISEIRSEELDLDDKEQVFQNSLTQPRQTSNLGANSSPPQSPLPTSPKANRLDKITSAPELAKEAKNPTAKNVTPVTQMVTSAFQALPPTSSSFSQVSQIIPENVTAAAKDQAQFVPQIATGHAKKTAELPLLTSMPSTNTSNVGTVAGQIVSTQSDRTQQMSQSTVSTRVNTEVSQVPPATATPQQPHLPVQIGGAERLSTNSADPELPGANYAEPQANRAAPYVPNVESQQQVAHHTNPELSLATDKKLPPKERLSRVYSKSFDGSGSNTTTKHVSTPSLPKAEAAFQQLSFPTQENVLVSRGETSLFLPVDISTGPSAGGALRGDSVFQRTDTPVVIARQLSEQAHNAQVKFVELRLNPEELGRVKMSLDANGDSVTVSIATERPETMALMRRHIDQLSQEFQKIGYSNVSFSFESQSGPGGQKRHSEPPPFTQTGASPDKEQEPTTAPRSQPSRLSGLDLRL